MSWLWLISVGVSDIQFPVWTKDEYGQLTGPYRFDPGRRGDRALHEDLLALASDSGVVFPNQQPERLGPALPKDLHLGFLRQGDNFIATIEHPEFSISEHGNEIPNAHEQQLPLFCPKLAPLISPARELFGNEAPTVVILNTRRREDAADASTEPVAAGPLAAKFLAERLDLTWVDRDGSIESHLPMGISTWVDILIGDEAMEDPEAQRAVVNRLGSIIQSMNTQGDLQVLATTSGGMPPLKPLFARVPATCLGLKQVKLLDNPERRSRSAAAPMPLNYDASVAEQETMRFYCAQALRERDYAGAYGIANRYRDTHWGRPVRELLGPLLELPGSKAIRINGNDVSNLALLASRVEICLSMNDVVGALKHFATFLETALWNLIGNDARIRDLELDIDREGEYLIGDIPDNHPLWTKQLIKRSERRENGYCISCPWEWPKWLNDREGGQQKTASTLVSLWDAFDERNVKRIRKANGRVTKIHLPCLREWRNRILHGQTPKIGRSQFVAIKDSFTQGSLIATAVDKPFGENFLDNQNTRKLLNGLACSSEPIEDQMRDLLQRVTGFSS